MLDFNEVFWRTEKSKKNAENAKNTRKNSWKTADSENFFADALRCTRRPRGRGTLWMSISERGRVALRTPISERGRVALQTRIIGPPLVPAHLMERPLSPSD